MAAITMTLISLLSVSLVVPVGSPELTNHLQWVHVWIPSLGLLGMGLRGLLGGDDDDDETADPAENNPLGYGFDSTPTTEDDGFDDVFDDGLGVEEDPLAEVATRIDDLENGLLDLESTVSAVSDDHEGVKESLEQIEDNVRKLLEVYEVVTQGMNPFADDAPDFSGTMNADGGGRFGLLDADEKVEDDIEPPTDEVEEEISADELFDDVDESAEDVEFENEADDEVDEGLSFDDLKSEFEFVGDVDVDGVHGAAAAEEAKPDQSGGSDSAEGNPEKPYLRHIPAGFGADLVLIEWVDYLVAESSVQETIRAVQYYTSMDWISDEIASHLQTVLTGMSPSQEPATTDGGQPIELTVDHHMRSLEYISQLRTLGTAGSPRRGHSSHGTTYPQNRGEDHGVQR